VGVPNEEGSKKEVPKSEALEEQVQKEEIQKKEPLKDNVPKNEVKKKEVPNEKILKEGAPKKFWWFTGVMSVLAALIMVFLPEAIKDRKATSSPEQPYENALNLSELPPEQLYKEALKLSEHLEYKKAVTKLENLISIWDDYISAYILGGRLYMENLYEYQNAQNMFQKGLDKDPRNRELLFYLGVAYHKTGEFDSAINFNNKALDVDSNFIIAIYNHGIYNHDYWKKCENDSFYLKAKKYYEKVIRLGQEHVSDAMFNLAALFVTRSQRENPNHKRTQYVNQAVGFLYQAIERDAEQGPRQGRERLEKVTGKIPGVEYGEDLEPIRKCPNYIKMIKKWKDQFSELGYEFPNRFYSFFYVKGVIDSDYFLLSLVQ